ncbi:hypothetical protein [Marinobacter sp.]|uniref:hypothetical protein n=1 Tax=Marinobacter sp. TaxID=50741 RepID=UPI00387E6324
MGWRIPWHSSYESAFIDEPWSVPDYPPRYLAHRQCSERCTGNLCDSWRRHTALSSNQGQLSGG